MNNIINILLWNWIHSFLAYFGISNGPGNAEFFRSGPHCCKMFTRVGDFAGSTSDEFHEISMGISWENNISCWISCWISSDFSISWVNTTSNFQTHRSFVSTIWCLIIPDIPCNDIHDWQNSCTDCTGWSFVCLAGPTEQMFKVWQLGLQRLLLPWVDVVQNTDVLVPETHMRLTSLKDSRLLHFSKA